jgi:ATP-dependent DNA helicase RecQ
MDKLQAMYHFCAQPQCRHKVIARYFNQVYDEPDCRACDYCLKEVEMVDDPLKTGQVILGGIEGLADGHGRSFGANYIAHVLKGKVTDQMTRWRHEQSGSFGTMVSESLPYIHYMIEQLVGQGFLEREEEYATLLVTEAGRRVLRGDVTPVLARPLAAKKKKEIGARQKAKRDEDWAGVDESLFELLRRTRAELARKQGVPAYIVFGDRSLKDMALRKPLTHEDFSAVFGVGEHKLKTYGDAFINVIRKHGTS